MKELAKRVDDVTATSAMEEAFRSAKDRGRKTKIAGIIGQGKRLEQWMYEELASNAAEAIRSDVPSMFLYDSAGQFVRGEVTKEFSQWCRDHDLSQIDCNGKYLREFTTDILALGMLHDQRAIPLLREGLKARSPLIVLSCISALSIMPDVTVVDDMVMLWKDVRMRRERDLLWRMIVAFEIEGAPNRLRFLLENDSFNKYMRERSEYVQKRAKRKTQ